MTIKMAPNFFIIGAPKCGTTAMWEYLRTHPQIFMCEPKEPWFLASDFAFSRDNVTNMHEYLHLFCRAAPCHVIRGEASVLYLASRVAVGQIARFFPGSRLLVMLRSPVDVYPSYHRQMLVNHHENELCPQRAWMLQVARGRGDKIPRGCREPQLLQYRTILSFGSQLEKALDNYPRQLVHIEFFDDLVTNPRGVYERTLEFLGLESDGRRTFPRVNERWKIRSLVLWRLLHYRRVPLPLRKVGRFFCLHHLHRLIYWNLVTTHDRKKEPLPDHFRAELLEAFRDEILLLQELTGRDLSHWLELKLINSPSCQSERGNMVDA